MGDKEVEYEFIDEVEKLEEEVQEISLSGKEDQPQIRNVLLIGSTGNGKSTLGNVLVNKNDDFEEVFRESSGSVSETKGISEEIFEVPITPDGKEKIIYRIIDTIGLGDTTLTQQGVLVRLAKVAERVKVEGLNHILFVAGGRFTEKEIEAYDLLKSVIFDEGVVKYTTIVRTRFDDFQDKAACDEDRGKLRKENPDLANILMKVNIIYVDNPPLKGNAKKIEVHREEREKSRDSVIKCLVCKPGNYRPSNIDTLSERVEEYRTNDQLLKEKMKELEGERKEAEKKFREAIENMTEEQEKMMKENDERIKELHKQGLELKEIAQRAEERERQARKEAEERERQTMEKIEKIRLETNQEIEKVRREAKAEVVNQEIERLRARERKLEAKVQEEQNK